VELGAGAILPMALFLIPKLRVQRRWQVTGALLLLFGVLMNRFNATLFAQLSRPNASYIPNIVEWLSTLGVLSAAALAWYFGVRFLSIFDSTAHEKYHR
jgi:Ni/Fe-hydrogenase subunit HybB-like protein